jgi:hypothetical protein
MFRIIYHTPELGYRVLDRITQLGFTVIKLSLMNAGANIICTIDFRKKTVYELCNHFLDHKDDIHPMLFDEGYIQM